MQQAVYLGMSEDGKKAVLNINGQKVWAYPQRNIEDSVRVMAPNTSVHVNVQRVESQRPDGKPFNRLVAFTANGPAPPPSMQPAGVAAQPAVRAAASTQAADLRDEMIWTQGILNSAVRHTGDTSIAELVAISLRAREAFQVVWRGKPLPQPAKAEGEWGDYPEPQ